MKSMSNCFEFIQEQQKNKWIESQTTDHLTLFSWDFQSCPTCRVLNVAERRAGWMLTGSRRSPCGTRRGGWLLWPFHWGPHACALCWIASCQFPSFIEAHSAELFLCPHLETFSEPSPASPGCASPAICWNSSECSAWGLTWLPRGHAASGGPLRRISLSARCELMFEN